jgi:TetR/AcrR family transcriptional regulator, repressor for uid operon
MRTRDDELNLERRKAILDAAAICFVREGFHATSMKEVCVQAGMSPGTLYHYFSAKDEIVAAIVEAETRFVAEVLESLASAEDFLAAFADALTVIAANTTERDLALYAEISAEALRQPALRAKAAEADRAGIAAMEAGIAKARSSKLISGDADPRKTAELLAILIDGWLWQATLKGPEWLKEQVGGLIQAATILLQTQEKAP